jgi:hypothetical protein
MVWSHFERSRAMVTGTLIKVSMQKRARESSGSNVVRLVMAFAGFPLSRG